MYIHERKHWPDFTWDCARLVDLLALVRYQQGKLLGRMSELGFQLEEQATLLTLTKDVIKTSEIEGEKLDDQQVRSSIARHLGIDIGGLAPKISRYVDGIVEVLLDATRHYEKPLSKTRLCNWHAALFPTGRSGLSLLLVGEWRNKNSGPMQMVSGSYGNEKIHFEAPSYSRVPNEMAKFIKWFNTPSSMDFVIKSALAHFWFVTIHPFEDGNGRIARALADMLLAQGENCKQRYYSLSAQIQRERKQYYSILEACQKGSLDVTDWIEWYLKCMLNAINASSEILSIVNSKASFWKKYARALFNERQLLIIDKLFNGFEGKLNSSKWAKMCKCSQDTALRDINHLVEIGVLIKEEGGGRSTSYQLNIGAVDISS
jgi:Fic family protein